MVTRQLCIADDSGAQTCITKAQLDIVLATMTHAEAPKPTEATVQAAAETPAAEPVIVAEAAVEPEIAAQPSAEPVEAAVEEPVQTTNTEQQVEIAPESTEAEHTGSLPAPGAALIWYPDVETTLP
jgi:hypothetical protein